MDSIDHIMGERAKRVYSRKRDYHYLIYVVVIALLLVVIYQMDIANSHLEGRNIIERRRNEIMTRNHNLDVFYKSMTCDDLPVDVRECELANREVYVARWWTSYEIGE